MGRLEEGSASRNHQQQQQQQQPLPPSVSPSDANQDLYGPPPYDDEYDDDDDDDYSHNHNQIHTHMTSSSDHDSPAPAPAPAPAPTPFPPPPPPPQNQNHGFVPHPHHPILGIQIGHPVPPPPPPPAVATVGFQPLPAPSPAPAPAVMIIHNNKYKDWSTHLFACMDDPQNAIITLFFPCVTFGQIAEIVDSGSTSCGTSGMLYALIAFCIAMPCILSCSYRSKMRERFGLAESPTPDWIIHCFCEHCALCQEYRELQKQGFDPTIGWIGNAARNQLQQQQMGMTPPMQQTMI